MWSDEHRLELEGAGSRFPVVPIDFAANGIAGGRRGAWALMIDGDDLTANALGSLRLFLNTSHPRISALFSMPEQESSRQYLAMIHYDITRQLLHFALQQKEFNLGGRYEPDSLGAVLERIVIPLQQSLGELRARYTSDPGELEAEFQAVTGLVD
jgi:hypothetical protein